MAENNKGRENS